jgi:glycosyltransferase involved in cell wall biosynthesis
VSEKSENLQIGDACRPLITVAMPVFNAGRFLRPAILSIVRQSFSDWELIIIDDGSTDGSIEGVKDIWDQRIRVLKDGANKGLAARLNEAIDLARGHYFARMDQDDVSYPDRFARQVEALQADPNLDLVGVRSIAISDTDEVIGTLPYALTLAELCAKPWRGFYLAHPTWMGRIEWFRFYRYAIPAPYLCEDQEMLLRSYSSSQFATVSDILFAYRVHRKVDWYKLVKMRWAVLEFQVRYFIGSPKKHFGLLAIIVFFARIAKDLMCASLQADRRFLFGRNRNANVEKFELLRWKEVLENLSLSDSTKVFCDNENLSL